MASASVVSRRVRARRTAFLAAIAPFENFHPGPDADPDTPLSSIGSTDVVTLTPDDTLVTALERIVDEEVEHLPVLDDDRRIVGMCTRTDILRARGRHLAAEQSQQGWHAAWRSRRAESNGSD